MTQERKESPSKEHHEASYNCEQLELNSFESHGRTCALGLYHLRGKGAAISTHPRLESPQAKECRYWQKSGSQVQVLWKIRVTG